jgi:hypothetical protein
MKSDKTEKSPEASLNSSVGLPDDVPDLESQLPVDERSRVIFELFESSIDRLKPIDRAVVMDQFEKLQGAFALLSKSVDGILSTEEGRRLFEQEVKRRQGT